MRKFGQYAVVFDGAEFASRVTETLKTMHCNLAYNGIEYCNKNDHEGMRSKINKLKPVLEDFSIYFIKDKSYEVQHEWRYIIDRFQHDYMLNPDKSLDLKIKPFNVSNIIDIDKMTRI